MSINFISSIDSDETRNLRTKKDNVEIMMGNETDDIIEELFEFPLQKYQEGLEESMKGSEFFFLIVLICCITIFKKQASAERDHHT